MDRYRYFLSLSELERFDDRESSSYPDGYIEDEDLEEDDEFEDEDYDDDDEFNAEGEE